MVKVKTDMTGWNMWDHGVPESKLTVIKQVEDIELLNEDRFKELDNAVKENSKQLLEIA